MCFEVILSTNYPDDLSKFDTVGVYFERYLDNLNIENVKYKHIYRVATPDVINCCCYFRVWDFAVAKSLNFDYQALVDYYGFDDDYYEDDEKNIGKLTHQNTQFLLQIIINIINQGYCVDFYSYDIDENPFGLETKTKNHLCVNINTIIKEQFYFYCDYLYEFVK